MAPRYTFILLLSLSLKNLFREKNIHICISRTLHATKGIGCDFHKKSSTKPSRRGLEIERARGCLLNAF